MKKLIILSVIFFFSAGCDQATKLFNSYFNSAPKQTVSEKKVDKKVDKTDKVTEKPIVAPADIAKPATENSFSFLPKDVDNKVAENPAPVVQNPPMPLPPPPDQLAVKTIETPALLPSPEAPTPVPAPINLKKKKEALKIENHLGGAIDIIYGDARYVYVTFVSKLVVLDRELNFVSETNLENKIIHLVSRPTADGARVFVEDGEGILSILEVKTTGIKLIRRFDTQASFDVFYEGNRDEVLVYLSDKIQILDVTQPDQPSVLGNILIPNAREAYPLGEAYFVNVDTQLTVVKKSDFSILSSVNLGTPFKILGHKEGADAFLYVALKTPQGQWGGVQILPLAKSGIGLADLGRTILFDQPVPDIRFDAVNFLASACENSSPVIVDLSARKQLSFDASLTACNQMVLLGPSAYVVSRGVLQHLEMKRSTLSGANVSNALANPKASVLKDISFNEKKTLMFPAKPETLFLLSADKAVVTDNSDGRCAVYTNNHFALNSSFFNVLNVGGKAGCHFSLFKPKGQSVMFYDDKNAKWFSLKEDFSAITETRVEPTGPLVTLSKKILATFKPSITDLVLSDVSISPLGKVAFVLANHSDGRQKIVVIDLTGELPTEVSLIDLSITPEQWRGLTYSLGGNRLILPTNEGVSVFNVQNPKSPLLEFTWDIGPAYFADVMNKGQTLCVAQGEEGIVCGRFY
jgi:hypothetical protein